MDQPRDDVDAADARLGPDALAQVRAAPFWRVAWQTVVDFANSDASITAGHLAFIGLLALFPFTLFLVALAGFVGQTEAASTTIEIALDLLPPEVRDAIVPAIQQIRGGTTPGLLTVGILGALWASSSGIEGMRHALDQIYDHQDKRMSFVMQRLQSLLLTIVSALGALLLVLILVGVPFVQQVIAWVQARELGLPEGFDVARYAIGLGLLLGMCVMLHLTLPAARLRLREVMPGAIVSVVAWAGVAWAYSGYLRYLGSYNLTYGSLGGIVLTLFFFYISAAVFILGAQLNGTLRRLRRTPAADAPPA